MAKFILKKDKTAFDKLFRAVLRFLRIPLSNYAVIVHLDDGFKGNRIMVGNHSGAKGASVYRLSSPDKDYFMSWGAHQMIEGYKDRRAYLKDIFYGQKLGYSKAKANASATVFAMVSKIIYRVAGILPIYYDMRFKSTIEHSLTCFENGVSIMIFPEDSSKGYFDEITSFSPGFLYLSKIYYKKYGIDLPIYPAYFNRHYMKIVFGKPLYYQELLKTHTQDEILKIFVDEVNGLNHKYILRDKPLAEGDLSLEDFDKKTEEALAKMAKRDVKNIRKLCKEQEEKIEREKELAEKETNTK